MSQSITAGNNLFHKKTFFILLAFAAVFVIITMVQDYIESGFQKTGFYFSESFMFSSFWWLFVPFLYAQYFLASRQKALPVFFKISIIILPALLHLFAYPGLVWLISKLFYYHTFRYTQTFSYSLSEHLYFLLFFYTVPFLLYLRLKVKKLQNQDTAPSAPPPADSLYQSLLFVQDGAKRIPVAVADILYFTASPPYINIHLNRRKYLYSETLKSIAEKTDSRDFIRIHKSTIINIKQVASYTSRLNGDYDVTMQDGNSLRLSRNYAAGFKTALQQSHQLTTK